MAATYDFRPAVLGERMMPRELQEAMRRSWAGRVEERPRAGELLEEVEGWQRRRQGLPEVPSCRGHAPVMPVSVDRMIREADGGSTVISDGSVTHGAGAPTVYLRRLPISVRESEFESSHCGTVTVIPNVTVTRTVD
eukprot:764359-Hanusia_phi.AAC.1